MCNILARRFLPGINQATQVFYKLFSHNCISFSSLALAAQTAFPSTVFNVLFVVCSNWDQMSKTFVGMVGYNEIQRRKKEMCFQITQSQRYRETLWLTVAYIIKYLTAFGEYQCWFLTLCKMTDRRLHISICQVFVDENIFSQLSNVWIVGMCHS